MRKRKIVLLGASGQLGGELSGRLCRRSDVELTPLSHHDVELSDAGALAEVFSGLRPWAFINCAAYNLVDGAESDPGTAFALNTSALVPLAALCRDARCLLVHFSTDYVFAGSRKKPYPEDAPACPLNVYGLSKHAGESLLRLLHPRVCIVRTCGVYGRHRSPRGKVNFVDSILAQARSGIIPKVLDNLVCTPTSAADLAEAVERLVDLEAVGTFHATNSGSCSWHEFASEALSSAGLDCRPTAVPFARGAGRADRPKYTVLSNSKLHSTLDRPMASWQDAVARYVRYSAK